MLRWSGYVALGLQVSIQHVVALLTDSHVVKQLLAGNRAEEVGTAAAEHTPTAPAGSRERFNGSRLDEGIRLMA